MAQNESPNHPSVPPTPTSKSKAAAGGGLRNQYYPQLYKPYEKDVFTKYQAIIELPLQTPLSLRPGSSFNIPSKPTPSSQEYKTALVHQRGVVQDVPCACCAEASPTGPYQSCVVLDGVFNGACTNCAYVGLKNNKCSLMLPPKALPKDIEIINLVDDDDKGVSADIVVVTPIYTTNLKVEPGLASPAVSRSRQSKQLQNPSVSFASTFNEITVSDSNELPTATTTLDKSKEQENHTAAASAPLSSPPRFAPPLPSNGYLRRQAALAAESRLADYTWKGGDPAEEALMPKTASFSSNSASFSSPARPAAASSVLSDHVSPSVPRRIPQEQADVLWQQRKIDPNPDKGRRAQLAQALNLPINKVDDWFRNRIYAQTEGSARTEQDAYNRLESDGVAARYRVLFPQLVFPERPASEPSTAVTDSGATFAPATTNFKSVAAAPASRSPNSRPTQEQERILHEERKKDPYVSNERARELAKETGMDVLQIKNWFSNRRAAARKDGGAHKDHETPGKLNESKRNSVDKGTSGASSSAQDKPGFKTCETCGIPKLLSDFRNNKKKTIPGLPIFALKPYCIPCEDKKRREEGNRQFHNRNSAPPLIAKSTARASLPGGTIPLSGKPMSRASLPGDTVKTRGSFMAKRGSHFPQNSRPKSSGSTESTSRNTPGSYAGGISSISFTKASPAPTPAFQFTVLQHDQLEKAFKSEPSFIESKLREIANRIGCEYTPVKNWWKQRQNTIREKRIAAKRARESDSDDSAPKPPLSKKPALHTLKNDSDSEDSDSGKAPVRFGTRTRRRVHESDSDDLDYDPPPRAKQGRASEEERSPKKKSTAAKHGLGDVDSRDSQGFSVADIQILPQNRNFDSPSSRLARMEQKRTLDWNQNNNYNLKHVANVESALAFCVGDIAVNPCDHCTRKLGGFVTCVVVPGFFKGSCASCHYQAMGSRCSFRENPKSHDTPSKNYTTRVEKPLTSVSTARPVLEEAATETKIFDVQKKVAQEEITEKKHVDTHEKGLATHSTSTAVQASTVPTASTVSQVPKDRPARSARYLEFAAEISHFPVSELDLELLLMKFRLTVLEDILANKEPKQTRRYQAVESELKGMDEIEQQIELHELRLKIEVSQDMLEEKMFAG